MATSRVCVSVVGSVLIFVVLLSAAPAGAATLTVCPTGCDDVTIQGAADDANAGDTIQILSVLPHTEANIFLTRDLTIEGLGELHTIIQASAAAGAAMGPVFVVTNGANIAMTALTVRRGKSSEGGGISILDGSVTLEDVTVRENTADSSGGGIYVAARGSLEANRATIESNHSGSTGGGVAAEGPVEMTGTDVTSNSVDATGVGEGGGIWSAGTLILRSCRLDSNRADGATSSDKGYGGGLSYQGPDLLIEDSSISSNAADTPLYGSGDAKGGGLFLTGTGAATVRRTAIRSNTAWLGAGLYSENETLVLEDCTISNNNAAVSSGGGMELASGSVTSVVRILHSTISENQAFFAGGGLYIVSPGRVLISNSTISGNLAGGQGGGIADWHTGVEIASSTIADNTADADTNGSGDGGGIWILSGESIKLQNTIVGSNHDLSPPPSLSATDCYGTVQSAGYNLIQSVGQFPKSCIIVGITTGNVVGVDALLDVLADNGGPTETQALDAGSVAIDAANPGGCLDPDGALLDADQRHGLRQDRCDMGAFEVGALVEPIFADGFESGSTSEWSISVP